MGKNRGDGIFDKNIKHLLRKGLLSALACLAMFSFLAFSIPLTSHATENIISDTTPTDPTVDTDTNLTGTQDERTNITDPGSAETPDDLKKLNIANTVTVTYDNGNGMTGKYYRYTGNTTVLNGVPYTLCATWN